eukprot:gene19579-1970_t
MPAELRPAGVGGGNVQTSGFILIAFVAGTLLGGLTFSSHIAPTAHDYEHVDQTVYDSMHWVDPDLLSGELITQRESRTEEHDQAAIARPSISLDALTNLKPSKNVDKEGEVAATPAAAEPDVQRKVDTAEEVWSDARIRNIILPKSPDPLQYIGEPRKTLAFKDRKKRLSDEWMNKSTEIALADGRGLITAPHAMIHAGHGNAQFVLAGIVALAHRFNLIPVVPCRKFGKLHTSPFFNFHCVDTRYVRWKGLGDGTTSNHGIGYQNEIRFRSNHDPPIHTSISGYMQMYSAFGYEKEAVCWAQRPDDETQQKVVKYWNEVVVANVTADMNEHTSVVAVHVRRGDYISDKKKELHGALSVQYYKDAWGMIMGRIGLSDNTPGGDVIKNVVVLVFAASNSIDWARDNLDFPGSRRVHFVTPNQGGRGPGADIDILALGLADYYILANSTFCWWAHFYASCRRMFDHWWSKKWDQPRRNVKTTAVALPHRWHKARCSYSFLLYPVLLL